MARLSDLVSPSRLSLCPQNWYGNCSTSRYLLLSQARAVRMHDPACLGTWRRARAAPQTRERQHVFVLGLGIPTVRYGLRPVLVYAPFLYCGCESQTTTTHRIPPLRASSRYSPSFGLASKFGLSGARRRRPSFGRPSGGGGRLYVGRLPSWLARHTWDGVALLEEMIEACA